ncbi:MAG: hypothetical protein ABR532_08940 [Candidatus Dormibacteria bacterium]
MRTALIARSDHRGLGIQTRDYYRCLRPSKTLHVRMTNRHGSWTPYAEHPEWYPDARQTDFNGLSGTLEPEEALRWLLDGVDVLLTAETAYDHRAWEWARQAGVRTVLVGNPEFLSPDKVAGADVILAPSTWQLARFPGVVHLPQPVDRSVFAHTHRPLNDPPRFLHVVGNRAARDRAGTDVVLNALRFARHKVDLTVRCQSALSTPQELLLRGLRRNRPTVIRDDVSEPQDLYAGFDVLLAPRRYGGLSLPVNEAASCGLAILVGDREPENGWLSPESLLPVATRRETTFQGGTFHLDDVAPQTLALAIDRLIDDPAQIARLSEASAAYARRIDWEVQRPRWLDVLGCIPALSGVNR